MFKKQIKPKVCGQILLINQEELLPGPFKLRHFYQHENLEKLASSIRTHGILQPLHVRQKGSAYQVIMGQRRLRAARIAGLSRIPCLIIEATDRQAAIYSLLENKQQEKIKLFEEIEAIEKCINHFGFTYKEVEEVTGKTVDEIQESQNLLKLPEDIRKTITKHNVSYQKALLLLRLPSNDIKESALDEIIKNKLSFKESNELIRNILSDIKNLNASHKILYNDIRVFTNTIDYAIKRMKESDIAVDIEKKETQGTIKYIIEIPTTPKKANCNTTEIQLVK